MKLYRLYMDESFPGDFSFDNPQPRTDGMNCYCFAGVLIAEENIEPVRWAYKEFIAKWGIDYPLHYTQIRGKRGNFDWLGLSGDNLRDGEKFVDEYHDFMFSMPFEVYGCVIDRQFFEKNYSLSKPKAMRFRIKELAFCGAISMVYSKSDTYESRNIKIHIEEAGKDEDKKLAIYYKKLIKNGVVKYENDINIDFGVPNYSIQLVEKLQAEPKADPFIQIADFCAFVIAKSAYDASYRPYLAINDKIVKVLHIKERSA